MTNRNENTSNIEIKVLNFTLYIKKNVVYLRILTS